MLRVSISGVAWKIAQFHPEPSTTAREPRSACKSRNRRVSARGRLRLSPSPLTTFRFPSPPGRDWPWLFSSRRSSRCDRLCARGDNDASDAQQLRSTLDALPDTALPLIIDLSSATFIDSSVAGILVERARVAASGGRAFAVFLPEAASEYVRRLITTTQLDSILLSTTTGTTCSQACASGT
jgi:anti-anti-sigma factor